MAESAPRACPPTGDGGGTISISRLLDLSPELLREIVAKLGFQNTLVLSSINRAFRSQTQEVGGPTLDWIMRCRTLKMQRCAMRLLDAGCLIIDDFQNPGDFLALGRDARTEFVHDYVRRIYLPEATRYTARMLSQDRASVRSLRAPLQALSPGPVLPSVCPTEAPNERMTGVSPWPGVARLRQDSTLAFLDATVLHAPRSPPQ